MRHRGRFLNQDVERGSGDQFATVSANLPSTTPANASPAQAAAQSNPHRRPTTHQPPRVLSSEAFGRRPPTRLYRSTTGRHPKPFTKADLAPKTRAGRSTPLRLRSQLASRRDLRFQIVRYFAAILSQFLHDLLMQPNIHSRRVIHIAAVVQFLRKLLPGLEAALETEKLHQIHN